MPALYLLVRSPGKRSSASESAPVQQAENVILCRQTSFTEQLNAQAQQNPEQVLNQLACLSHLRRRQPRQSA